MFQHSKLCGFCLFTARGFASLSDVGKTENFSGFQPLQSMLDPNKVCAFRCWGRRNLECWSPWYHPRTQGYFFNIFIYQMVQLNLYISPPPSFSCVRALLSDLFFYGHASESTEGAACCVTGSTIKCMQLWVSCSISSRLSANPSSCSNSITHVFHTETNSCKARSVILANREGQGMRKNSCFPRQPVSNV